MRLVRASKGEAISGTFADGAIDELEWKTGQPAGQKYTARNSGRSETVLYVVVLK
jgi:hypothetical protein